MSIELMATILFGIAVVHTFMVGRFRAWAHNFREGSLMENLLHMLGEAEIVFLFWAGMLFWFMVFRQGWHHAVEYIEGQNYTEPKFVFVIMAIAATRPIVELVDKLIRFVGRLLPMSPAAGFLVSALVVGPLLGSFVTEPAAMTVTALVLKRQFFDRSIARWLKYMILGTMFVNVSIGGTLTPFAAPPVLMVAGKWNWGIGHMIGHFGWKAAVSVTISAMIVFLLSRTTLLKLQLTDDSAKKTINGQVLMSVPWWATMAHLGFLGFVVLTAHHSDIFFGGFVFFLGFHTATREFQEPLKLREALLVGGFLAGLVTLGGLQGWWIEPLLRSMGDYELYFAATGLTAITDNAALTYLGSLVQNLPEQAKYMLVAGAVTGGGLTVIANAPNPAGYSILNSSFTNGGSKDGISPWGLLAGAIVPTVVAICSFLLLPNL